MKATEKSMYRLTGAGLLMEAAFVRTRPTAAIAADPPTEIDRWLIRQAGPGLGAMDALHLAAAHLSRADKFITTEKPPKAIHRSTIVKVVYLFD